MPPLVIEDALLEEGLEILAGCVSEVLAERRTAEQLRDAAPENASG